MSHYHILVGFWKFHGDFSSDTPTVYQINHFVLDPSSWKSRSVNAHARIFWNSKQHPADFLSYNFILFLIQDKTFIINVICACILQTIMSSRWFWRKYFFAKISHWAKSVRWITDQWLIGVLKRLKIVST